MNNLGRTPKPKGTARLLNISISISEEERAWLDRLAARADLRPASWAYQVLRASLVVGAKEMTAGQAPDAV